MPIIVRYDTLTSANSAQKPTGDVTPADALGSDPSMVTDGPGGNQSNGTVCPTCDEDFCSNRVMKMHHCRVHGESLLNYQEVECEWCGEIVEKPAKDVEEHSAHYCSKACRGKNENKRQVVSCDQCGDDVEKRADQVEKYDHHFCDNGCSSKWESANRDYPSGEDHGKHTRVELSCDREGCDNIRMVRPSRKERWRFCSRDCAYDHLSGENSPHWKGGKTGSYGRGWNPQKREAVRERDGRECQNCGRSEAEHIELFGTAHHVHHITPARKFDDPVKRNAMSNLVTLCAGECHKRWEMMAPLRPTMADD